jgi:hypothetical protein
LGDGRFWDFCAVCGVFEAGCRLSLVGLGSRCCEFATVEFGRQLKKVLVFRGFSESAWVLSAAARDLQAGVNESASVVFQCV